MEETSLLALPEGMQIEQSSFDPFARLSSGAMAKRREKWFDAVA
jgi:hypothetical protein